jgi:uncharacterized secreted protein with C-terminal beta-propeller domain
MERRLVTLAVVAATLGVVVGAGTVSVFTAPAGPGSGATPGENDGTTDGPPELAQFDSPAAFSEYVDVPRTASSWRPAAGRPVATTVEARRAGEDDAQSGEGDGGGTAVGGGDPGRVSSTNVQVTGVDEPDVLKSHGDARVAFYAGPQARHPRDDHGHATDDGTVVVDVSAAADPAVIDEVAASGRMLLGEERLLVLSGDTVYGYDVSDPNAPTAAWTHEVNGRVAAARLVDDTAYLVVRQRADPEEPCPIVPLAGGPAVDCGEIHRPTRSVDSPTVYTTVALRTADGEVSGTASVVGSGARAATYVSEDAVYLTYSRSRPRADLLVDYVLEERALDATARERLREVRSYDLTAAAYRTEVRATVRAYFSRVDDRERARAAFREGFDAYLAERQRELVSTGVVRVGIGADPAVEAHGEVPGVPLNQFSMDASGERLRIATTVPGAGSAESVNDVYVLDGDLEIEGAATDMGQGQRVYAARFVGDTAYLVTFRQVDPFHVVDLSDPEDPEELGEVKLPGFSRYLHPLGEDRVLGVGREDGRAKAVVFDVSEPAEPRVVDAVRFDDRPSTVERTHHAFLQDRRHEVVFVPGSDGGHVFSYDLEADGDAALGHEATVDVSGPAVRAMYVEDHLHVYGTDEVAVVDERGWERVTTLHLEDPPEDG